MRLVPKVVVLALVIVTAFAAVSYARPVSGVFKGGFTAAFNNDTGRYESFGRGQTRNVLKMRVKRSGALRNFKARPLEFNCLNRAGEEIASYDVTPEFKKVRRGRRGSFRASNRLTFDGRTFTDSLKGRFTSRRRAKGRYKLRVSGCVGVMAAKFRLKKPRPPRRGGGGGGGGGGNPCGTPVYDPNAPNANGGTGGINYCPGLYRY